MAVAYHAWRGLIFGDDGVTATAYPLTSSDRLEALSLTGGLITGGALDGSGLAPLRASSSSWVTVVDVEATSDAAFIVQRDALKAATWPGDDPLEEFPYDIYVGNEDPVTRFARCVDRALPHDVDSVVRNFAVVPLEFEASDPLTYTAVQTSAALDPSDTLVIDGEGWAPSYRWTATFTGPLTNPSLSSSLDGTAVFRYVGTIADGDELVVTVGPRSGSWELEGVNVYGSFDGGAAAPTRRPQWFPIVAGEQTLTFTATAGAGTCVFAHREAKP